jgi:hypothetical protein
LEEQREGFKIKGSIFGLSNKHYSRVTKTVFHLLNNNKSLVMFEKSPLSTSSPQYATLEYALQRALFSTTAKITSATMVSNPQLSLTFENKVLFCRLLT